MAEVIIGIDCATQPKRTGLARAVHSPGGYRATDLMVCDSERHPIEVVAEWIGGSETVLLALDAPLGWPTSLGGELADHAAGEPIVVPSELLFRRLTDRVVAARTGKTPLDVGADRIARTAHSALLFLYHLREAVGEAIPLAWETPLKGRVEAIEVYPAATLLARGASLRGYKRPGSVGERHLLLDALAPWCEHAEVRDVALRNHDCLDALACVVAGVDFLEGAAVRPREPDVARREGWIWFREVAAPPASIRQGPEG